jgi:DMSO reductase anchor subunit
LILLVIGSSFLLVLGISILVQRFIVSVIQSDSETENLENSTEDKFWRISFFVNLAFGAIIFLSSVICVAMDFGIGTKEYSGFGIRFSVFLGILFIASLVAALFLRIKDSVNEVIGLLGGLMMILSALVFGSSLFFGLNQLISPQYSSREMIEAIPFVPEVDETEVSQDSAYAVIDSAVVDSTTTFG